MKLRLRLRWWWWHPVEIHGIYHALRFFSQQVIEK